MRKDDEPRQVYISYSRPDAFVARVLADYLMSQGIRVWYDMELVAGESFARVLRDQLNQASAIIVLWSQRSVQSEWVREEASFAVERDIYFPIMLDDSWSGLSPPFATYNSLRWDPARGISIIAQDLLAFLERLNVKPTVDAPQRLDKSAAVAKTKSKGFAFLSHVEEDVPIVSKISDFLKTRGYAYWTYHESDRDYQKPTVLEIEERMLDSALVLTVISPEWKRSGWTQRELAFAREARKPLFHLRFRNPGPTLAIAGDTYFDFERGEQEAFAKLGIELDKKGL
jgi:hypothetical protein